MSRKNRHSDKAPRKIAATEEQGRSAELEQTPDVSASEIQGSAGGPGFQSGRNRTNRIRPHDEESEMTFEGGRGNTGHVFDEEEMGEEMRAEQEMTSERERQKQAEKEHVKLTGKGTPKKGGTAQQASGQHVPWQREGARISR